LENAYRPVFYPGTVRGSGIARYPILILFKALAGWLAGTLFAVSGWLLSEWPTRRPNASVYRQPRSRTLLHSAALAGTSLFLSVYSAVRGSFVFFYLFCIDSLWTCPLRIIHFKRKFSLIVSSVKAL
jgi:hypothetical protein